ncbi:hypothetical protein ACFYO0_35650 [Streptomyces sp. NPDC006365]|uniref:hypothetical protein n=1 Tax=Streptomyces sp. NPDC006365 TaxID=3364744 RepID=UPI0036AE0DCF
MQEALNSLDHLLSLGDGGMYSVRAVGRIGLPPAALCYSFLALTELWGSGVATLVLVAVIGTGTAMCLRGAHLEERDYDRSHPGRRLVLEPLL